MADASTDFHPKDDALIKLLPAFCHSRLLVMASLFVILLLCAFAAAASPFEFISPELSPELSSRAVNSQYIFTAFTNSSEHDLFVYTSDDGTNFSLMKGPAYTPTTGVLRDPSIILHTDGNYYIAYTTNWTGTNFAIATSSDLLSWTLVTTVPTASSVITPINTWAPEFFKDTRTGELNIVVSLSTSLYGPFLPYVFTATDSTLKTWTGPVVMSGISNAGLGYIDTFPILVGSTYHIFTKAESIGKKHIEHAIASSLTGPYTFVQTGDFAGWGEVEGGCVTQLANGTYRLYMDGFSSGKYIYSDSADLYTWSAYELLPNLSGTVRHGTVMRQF